MLSLLLIPSLAGKKVAERKILFFFCDVCRCVIVPHIGSATLETRLGMVNLAARNALAAIDEEAMPAELDVAARITSLP
jgi:lactate dehydrogenase-like 2-hydroxyacid dehydrogenase